MTQHDVPHLLAVLVALLAATKVLGLLAQRIGQPSVVGELVAGIILGKSLLGILDLIGCDASLPAKLVQRVQ